MTGEPIGQTSGDKADDLSDDPTSPDDIKAFLERYSEHARRLQTWIGAFGVGLASVLVYQFRTYGEKLDSSAREAAREMLGSALTLIAIAIASQVTILLINKFTQLSLAHPPTDRRRKLYRTALWISERSEFDLVADALAVVCLSLATVRGLSALGIM